jgi:Tat protein secretion system quality control protein TatD with DNase activity
VPWNIKLSAEKIAAEKGVTKQAILTAAKENAIRVFNLELSEIS